MRLFAVEMRRPNPREEFRLAFVYSTSSKDAVGQALQRNPGWAATFVSAPL